jgi:hypothetical protein
LKKDGFNGEEWINDQYQNTTWGENAPCGKPYKVEQTFPLTDSAFKRGFSSSIIGITEKNKKTMFPTQAISIANRKHQKPLLFPIHESEFCARVIETIQNKTPQLSISEDEQVCHIRYEKDA